MKKLLKYFGTLALLFFLFCVGVLVADKVTLRNDVVRLHVIANSDKEQDQQIKLRVKDAIVRYIRKDLARLENADQAKAYLKNHISQLENVANDVLVSMGSDDRAKAILTTEKFGAREYDTFSLPSGMYESLRIEIGEGKGKNWWCVVFPALCLPASQDGFKDVAASAGFQKGFVNTLTKTDGYEIRFYILDCLGKLENLFSIL